MKHTHRYDLQQKKPLLATVRATLVVLLGLFSSVGPLSAHADELALGNAEAPVTIIEYGSLTCDHCAHFHFEVFPIIKTRHIEKGHVRFIFRDFPTSTIAIRGAVAARCASDRHHDMLGQLFTKLDTWASADDINAALIAQATTIGLDKNLFKTCITNPENERAVVREQQRAKAELGVTGTPTFIINGKKVNGFQSADELELLIQAARRGTELPATNTNLTPSPVKK